MKTCRTCQHWTEANKYDGIAQPFDPDTGELMESQFVVKLCRHPELLFCERPLRFDGFAVADGSNYHARLYTAQEFGCVLHESANNSDQVQSAANEQKST